MQSYQTLSKIHNRQVPQPCQACRQKNTFEYILSIPYFEYPLIVSLKSIFHQKRLPSYSTSIQIY